MCITMNVRLLLILVLSGCQFVPEASRVVEHCAIPRETSWEVVILDPSLTVSLMDQAEEELNVEGEYVNDVWFKNSYGDLKLCRYEAIKDTCSSRSVTLDFRLNEGAYQPAQVMEKVCFVHTYRT